MKYVIDGHNLINALPDISLEDEHDEALLVEKLKSFCARTRKTAVVIFDHGIPGGQSRDLSTSQVEVRFAAAYRTNADALIKKRIRAARDPQQYTVISSDREVLAVAADRRMPAMTSEVFAAYMAEVMARAFEDARSEDVKLSAEEVDEWLRLFGEQDA